MTVSTKNYAIRAILLASACGVAAGAWIPANAQQFERNRNVSVRERPQPDFDPIGIPVGSFRAYLTMPLGVSYVDNIFAAPTGEESDYIFSIQPDLELRSQWSRHELTLTGGLDHRSFSDFDSENTTDGDLAAAARIEVQRNTTLRARVTQSWLNERRTEASSPVSLEPVEFTLGSVSGGFSHGFNRLKFDVDASQSEYDYEDAGAIDQDFRDLSLTTASVRTSYALSPATAVFFRYQWNDRDFDIAGGRDSDGFRALVGADFDLTQLARGAVSVGYLTQEFDTPGLADVEGMAVSATVEWFPSEITTIEFGLERTIDDTGVVGGTNTLSTVYSVRGDHELRRNVIVSAQASVREDEYEGVLDREDQGVAVGLDATYLLNRHLGASVLYRYAERSSDGQDAGAEFTQHSLGLRLLVRY